MTDTQQQEQAADFEDLTEMQQDGIEAAIQAAIYNEFEAAFGEAFNESIVAVEVSLLDYDERDRIRFVVDLVGEVPWVRLDFSSYG